MLSSTIIVLGKIRASNAARILGSTIIKTTYNMKQKELRKVKRGEFFRLRASAYAPVWVRDEYNRKDKKFEAHKYDNIGHWAEFNGSRIVYVGFDF